MESKMAANYSQLFEDSGELISSYEEVISAYNTSTILTIIVLLLGLTANAIFLWSLLTGTNRRSRLRPFLVNLAIADLLVCCFTIAMELGWRLTVVWIAGDFACRVLSVTKTLGLYLEAFVVVVMSMDRCYVVLWPMRISGQIKRTRVWLACAWTAASLFSFPQVSRGFMCRSAKRSERVKTRASVPQCAKRGVARVTKLAYVPLMCALLCATTKLVSKLVLSKKI